MLPPTIKVERPAATLAGSESPFYVNTRARPWIAAAHPRRASVSSFGFGGSNFHVTLEEYVGENVADRTPTHATALFLVSASSREALAESAHALRARVVASQYFAEARATQIAYDPSAEARLACVAMSLSDLQSKLDSVALALRDRARAPNVAGTQVAFGVPDAGKVGFVFAGQGSQYVGMGADLAMEFPLARAVWDQAARTNVDSAPHRVAFPPPVFDAEALRKQEDALRQAAQPAIATMALAQLALLDAVGVQPDCAAGHSFGEVMALHAAGAFDAEAAVEIAEKRGAVMHAAAGTTEGAMTAIGAGREKIEEELRAAGFDVVIANDNGPDQVVISGPVAAIADAEARLSARGFRITRLPVASAFHSSIVSSASEPFGAYLAKQSIASPRIPVYGTAGAAPYPAEPASVRATLAAQLAMPVRFREQIESMYTAGVRTFVEVGPGSVLTALIERIVADRPANVLSLDRKGRRGLEAFWEALGRLALLGKRVEFTALWAGVRAEEPALPASPGVVPITGANFGKPYPAKIERVAPRPDVAPPVATPAPMLTAPAPATDRLALFAAFQEQIAESQKAFEFALAESHRSFLETTQKALEAMAGGAALPPGVAQPLPANVRRSMPAAPPAPKVMALAPKPAPAAPIVRAAPPPVTPAVDPSALLMSIVAEKTGYPVEMLNPAMSLEGDLGVDSIKQVEILAALRERAPNLPEVEANDLARLRTLGAIIGFLAESVAPSPASPVSKPTPLATPAIDVQATVLAVVAEKTGYPAEMLNESMTLEGDLGIDSIKQVEILAALRERAPALQDLEAADLTRLRTLGAIIAHLQGARASAAPTLATQPTVDRFVVELANAPAQKVERPLPPTIAIVPDRKGVALALAELLRKRGAEVQVAETVSGTPAAVLHMAGLDAVPGDQLVPFHRDALSAAKAVAPTFAREGGLFVTAQDTGGAFALDGSAGPALGLAGLVKCAAAEWPRAMCKAIDIASDNQPPSAVAAALLTEIFEGAADSEVALRGGTRRIVQHVPATAAPSTIPLDSRSVVVVTGGGKGVTAASTVALARAVGCRIVILGRSPLSGAPGDEIAATLAAVEAAGSKVRYLSVDVRDADAVARAMADVRREWGPISGLVHGAGVIADSRIVNKTSAQFDSVFGTKVIGLQSLLTALSDDPLKVLCVFSSVASRSGNVGQSDYAMANAVATQMAHAEAARRAGACLVKSIHWGPWEGGMVTPALAARFRGAGVPLIPLAAGADFFVREIGLSTPLEVLAGGPLPTAGRPTLATATAAE